MHNIGTVTLFFTAVEIPFPAFDSCPDYPCPGCGQPGVRYPAVCMKCKLVGEYIVSTTKEGLF